MMDMNQGIQGNEINLTRLDYDTIQQIIQVEEAYETPYLYFNNGLTISDDSGNETDLTGEKIDLLGSISDEGKTTLSNVMISDLGSNQYSIDLIFDDYLDKTSVGTFISNLYSISESPVTVGNGNAAVISTNYQSGIFYDVTLKMVIQMEEPLRPTDQVSINIENLMDYRGEQTWVSNEGVDRTLFNLIYDTEWMFDSPYLNLLEANTVDYDKNGKIDHIQLIFNKRLKDISYVDVGIVLNSTLISSGGVDTNTLATPAGLDYSDDTTIYFAVSEGDFSNTAAEGILDIGSSGMIESLSGIVMPSMNNININDKAGPVLVDSALDLSLPYDEKYISLTFSEPLNESDVVDVSTLKLMSSGSYASGPIDLYGTTSIIDNQIFIKPLTLGTVGDERPSFISLLSKYLYDGNNPTGGTASIRVNEGFSVSSDHGEAYTPQGEYPYPYDGPELSNIVRVNTGTDVSSVQFTTNAGIKVALTY